MVFDVYEVGQDSQFSRVLNDDSGFGGLGHSKLTVDTCLLTRQTAIVFFFREMILCVRVNETYWS